MLPHQYTINIYGNNTTINLGPNGHELPILINGIPLEGTCKCGVATGQSNNQSADTDSGYSSSNQEAAKARGGSADGKGVALISSDKPLDDLKADDSEYFTVHEQVYLRVEEQAQGTQSLPLTLLLSAYADSMLRG